MHKEAYKKLGTLLVPHYAEDGKCNCFSVNCYHSLSQLLLWNFYCWTVSQLGYSCSLTVAG